MDDNQLKPFLEKGTNQIQKAKEISLSTEKNNEISKEDYIKFRKIFVTKVYSILAIQFTITIFFVSLSFYSEKFQNFVKNYKSVYFLSTILSLITYIYPLFHTKFLKSFPLNYVYLLLFTISSDFVLCRLIIKYKPTTIFIALCLSIITIITLSIYSYYSKTDFTILGGNFFVTLNLFMISSCLRILFGIEYSKLIINGCCLIIFSTYIIYDTQLILGNQREKFNNNDYVLAAMCLYIDIINLFIEMIKIVAASLDENVDDKDNKDDGFELLLGLKKKYSDEEEDEKDNKKGKEKDSKKKKGKDKKEEKEDKKGKGKKEDKKDDKKGKKDDKKGKKDKKNKSESEEESKSEEKNDIESLFNDKMKKLTNKFFLFDD